MSIVQAEKLWFYLNVGISDITCNEKQKMCLVFEILFLALCEIEWVIEF